MLGVIGEYIGDIHAEVKRRPLYVVGELENFSDDARSCRRGRSSPTGAARAAAAGAVEAPDLGCRCYEPFGVALERRRDALRGARRAADRAASPSSVSTPIARSSG